MTSGKFEELLRLYKEKYGLDGEKILKMHVDNIRRELLVNEHTALEILYERTKKFSIKPERVIEISPQLKLNVRHDGESFTILYFPITEFVEELNLLGRALEYLEKRVGEVMSVIGNIGVTETGFHGVKGFAIVCKKRSKTPRELKQ